MALRSDLSSIRRNAAAATGTTEDPQVPAGVGTMDEPIDEAPEKQQAAPVQRRPVTQEIEQEVETVMSDAEAKVRALIASIEAEAAKVHGQIDAAIAKYTPKLDKLKADYEAAAAQLKSHLFDRK